MPKIEIVGPYWFHFYSNENREAAHVHVDRESKSAKFWLAPISLAGNDGFASHEVRKIVKLIEANKVKILAAWNQYEGQK